MGGNQSISSCNDSCFDEKSDKINRSATLFDLEALDCPICYDTLTVPIFQCDNGHIACSTCCNKLRNKCPSCSLRIGQIRCRAMERIIKGVTVPCPNVKLGCTKRFSIGKELSTHHEKECVFSPCSCPAKNCDYTGSYKDLISHFAIHKDELRTDVYQINVKSRISFVITEYTLVVIRDYIHGLMFVVQCFNEPCGVYVTLSCIAPPCAREVGEFACRISTLDKYNLKIDLPKVGKVTKLSSTIPKEDFILIPSFLFRGGQALKLDISISAS